MKEIEKELYEHGSKICRDVVNDNHVRLTLQKYTGGIIYKQNDEIVAFSLWTKETIQKGEIAMKLHVLCARENNLRLGSHMLHDLESECLSEHIDKIILTPATQDVVSFYKKANYVHNKNGVTMKKNIPKSTLRWPKNVRKTRKIRRQTMQTFNSPRYNEVNLSNT